jgi:hypothetical protein
MLERCSWQYSSARHELILEGVNDATGNVESGSASVLVAIIVLYASRSFPFTAANDFLDSRLAKQVREESEARPIWIRRIQD